MNDESPPDVARVLWHELLRGAWKVASTPGSQGCELLLCPADAPAPSPGRARRQAALESVLRGTPQKVVAAELKVSAPTLAGMLRCTLAEMGVDARVLRVPLALPLLAHAAGGAPWMAVGEAAQGPQPGLLIRVTARLPTESLAELLSASERVVTLRYLTGQSHVEIATARAVSPRTVANQLALSFEKLGASRRFELVRNLLERSWRSHASITLTPSRQSGFPERTTEATQDRGDATGQRGHRERVSAGSLSASTSCAVTTLAPLSSSVASTPFRRSVAEVLQIARTPIVSLVRQAHAWNVSPSPCSSSAKTPSRARL